MCPGLATHSVCPKVFLPSTNTTEFDFMDGQLQSEEFKVSSTLCV